MGDDRALGHEWDTARILDSLSELVVHVDLEMRIQWANQAACDAMGKVREELVGRYCHEAWAQRTEPCVDCPVLRAMGTGEPQELEKLTPDGRAWFIRADPVRDRADKWGCHPGCDGSHRTEGDGESYCRSEAQGLGSWLRRLECDFVGLSQAEDRVRA